MPYTTVTAGSTITASWANTNVRDQVVTPFASSSARSSAITAPIDGMVSYLQDTDVFEGYINGGWQQLLDWRQGKGLIYSKYRTTSGTMATGYTTEATVFSKTVTGLTAGRLYEVRCLADTYNATANGTWARFRVKDGTTLIGESGYAPMANSGFPVYVGVWCYYTAVATSVSLNVTLECLGSGSLSVITGTGTPFILAVTDVSYSNAVLES